MQTQNEEKSQWVEEAIDKYQGPLLRYTLRLIGNIEKAREIVQETFLKLWKVDKDKIKDYLAPWLFKLCRNHSLDLLKKEKKMELIDNDQLIEDTSQRDPAGLAIKHDQVANIKDAMKCRDVQLVGVRVV